MDQECKMRVHPIWNRTSGSHSADPTLYLATSSLSRLEIPAVKLVYVPGTFSSLHMCRTARAASLAVVAVRPLLVTRGQTFCKPKIPPTRLLCV